MRFKRGGAALLVALLSLALTAVVRAEEVTVEQYPDSNYEPGPGWPEGWTPPPVPALSDQQRQYLEEQLAEFPQFTQWEVRVLEPMPEWTQEYPYRWAPDIVECGSTLYVYWYPTPDTGLIDNTYNRSFITGGARRGPCLFQPVYFINESIKPDPETIAANERMIAVQEEMKRSRQGLERDFGDLVEGSPALIHVFFNSGYASAKFDVPAYLDATVGRVRVPIRFVSELMGAQVTWNEQTQQVTIHFPPVSRKVLVAVPKEGFAVTDFFYAHDYFPYPRSFLLEKQAVTISERSIILTIGEPRALVDGVEVPLDAPPVIRDGRTMVPIRFIAEQMGSKVYWVGDQPIFEYADGRVTGTYQVHIFTPFFPLYDYPSWYLETRALKF